MAPHTVLDLLDAIYPISHWIGHRTPTIIDSLQPGDEGYRRFDARFHYVTSLSWLDFASKSTPDRVAPNDAGANASANEKEKGGGFSSSSSSQDDSSKVPWYRSQTAMAAWTRFKLVVHSSIGSFAVLCWIALISRTPYFRDHNTPIVLASYGTEAVLVFCLPHLPSSQPASIVIGNTVSAIVATAIAKGFENHQRTFTIGGIDGVNWAAPAVAQMTAQAVMQVVGITHPPGAAISVLATTNPKIQTGVAWELPGQVLLISLLFLAWGLIVNNVGGRRWPMTWWWAPFYPTPAPPDSIADRVKGRGREWRHTRARSGSQHQAQASSSGSAAEQ